MHSKKRFARTDAFSHWSTVSELQLTVNLLTALITKISHRVFEMYKPGWWSSSPYSWHCGLSLQSTGMTTDSWGSDQHQLQPVPSCRDLWFSSHWQLPWSTDQHLQETLSGYLSYFSLRQRRRSGCNFREWGAFQSLTEGKDQKTLKIAPNICLSLIAL